MDSRLNGPAASSSSNGGAAGMRSSHSSLHPNQSSRLVQEALERLASLDLIELCKEAKAECCRATRDLRSCGRYVHHVLNSCGHASLCAECSQRCDSCPICRNPIPYSGARLQLRLYYECIEAGLISKRCDERFQDIEERERQLTADVERLYSLFDVALENNLISLVCHYVTDVCMDETAVSSDPVIAFLLDEVVVKDWCQRTFRNIVTELQAIYKLDVKEMRSRLILLQKFKLHMAGISNVLQILDSSFKGTLSAQLNDLHNLLESILKTKQHLEIMIWCTRHKFLENVRSRFTDSSSWTSVVRDRKLAAIERAWPDAINQSAESVKQDGSLFIEDALNNVCLDEGLMQDVGEKLKDASLQADIGGVLGCYPFKNLRAAADLLFLHGSSDMVIAKQAIFLYYLYDRHWTILDEEWGGIVEDFAGTFNVNRNSLLESLTFYLLDDHTEEALQKACCLLPEISGPGTHPKIAEVLLERDSPDAALMVLRWAGHDGGLHMISLREAITTVQVRVECGLLTEAFMHQRTLWTRVKEKKLNHGAPGDTTDKLEGLRSGWLEWVEVLVTEICCLCIRRNWVDQMIELPWNSDEEKHIHKCLLDYAIEDPLRTTGSLLVLFYIQRYRYAEAYRVHLKLEKAEEDSISEGSVSEEGLTRIKIAGHWRANLVDRCLELLPEVEMRQLRSGKLTNGIVASNVVESPSKFDAPQGQDNSSTSLLIPSSANSLLVPPIDHTTGLLRSSSFETSKTGRPLTAFGPSLGNFGSPSYFHKQLLNNKERVQQRHDSIVRNLRYDNKSTPRNHRIRFMSGSPLKGINRMSSNSSQDDVLDKISSAIRRNDFHVHYQNFSPVYPWKAAANSVTRTTLKHSKESANVSNMSCKNFQSQNDGPSWNMVPPDDPMDVSWSYTEKNLTIEESNANGGSRWRSDETSDDDEEQDLDTGMSYHALSDRTTRRCRLAKR